jgi:serine/threonine-protein kinase HipA
MGRPSMRRALDVWMNGEHIGVWRLPSRGAPEFVYVRRGEINQSRKPR